MTAFISTDGRVIEDAEARPLADQEKVEAYLDSMHMLDLDPPEYTDEDIRKLFIENLQNYVSGKVSQDFIIGLADRLMDSFNDEQLGDILHEIKELNFTRFDGKDVTKTPKQIDTILRDALRQLTK